MGIWSEEANVHTGLRKDKNSLISVQKQKRMPLGFKPKEAPRIEHSYFYIIYNRKRK